MLCSTFATRDWHCAAVQDTVTYISRLVATSETACPTHPDSHKPSVLSHPPKCRTIHSFDAAPPPGRPIANSRQDQPRF
ncbi:unnamed protein product [Clonostachys rosea f. rosea IK726]|uniref:Uncharacterized protein n=2 Tax=Bionectria ochroleuca TaxID=29856 RepID=A0A0B7JTR5_BIOOC|nr:unnamed protein product [Clonostachys rosea f. rosea IK726]